MSTDVYFDFHDPIIYPLWDDNWSKWYSKIVQQELLGNETYFVERVSHLSNLVIDNNFGLWDTFIEQYRGQVVDRNLIAKIILDWKQLYQEAQKPEAEPECQPTDMLTSGQIKILLNKYKGKHLIIRVD